MKILVTGGAGFIGSHLVERLLEEGHDVWNIDDFSAGKREFIAQIIQHPRHHFIEGSILNRALLQSVINEVELIYHLAAVLGVKNCVEDPLKVIEGNIEGTKQVLELAYPDRKKVVFASTSEVYGKNNRLPFHENDDRILGSTATHRWCYSTAKALDEHMCLAYAKKGLPVTVLRYFNAYGPRATATAYGGVIPKFIRAAIQHEPLEVFGTGEQSRCFTYIEDTIEGSYRAMDASTNGMIFNVGNDQPIAIMQLANTIKELAYSESVIVKIPYEKAYGEGYEDMFKRQPDLTRLRTILGYSPQFSLLTGLKKTLLWYKEQGKKAGRISSS